MKRKVISVERAAKELGVTVEIMKQLLIDGTPYGTAIGREKNGRMHYRYIVYKHRLPAYANACDFETYVPEAFEEEDD